MSIRWCIAVACLACLVACREAQDLPNPFTDGGVHNGPEDAGPIPDGAIGAPCPTAGCHPALVAVAEADGGCTCRYPCAPSRPLPRCIGWEVCAQLRQQLTDGGSQLLDAGVCLPAGAPNTGCSPAPCAEMLVCARLAGREDAGNTCRYACSWDEDGGIEDAAGRDAIPASHHCPPAQDCFRMTNDGGACFLP